MDQHWTGGLPEALTVREAAALLRISRSATVRALVTGQLPRGVRGLRVVVPTRQLLAGFGVPLRVVDGGDGDDC